MNIIIPELFFWLFCSLRREGAAWESLWVCKDALKLQFTRQTYRERKGGVAKGHAVSDWSKQRDWVTLGVKTSRGLKALRCSGSPNIVLCSHNYWWSVCPPSPLPFLLLPPSHGIHGSRFCLLSQLVFYLRGDREKNNKALCHTIIKSVIVPRKMNWALLGVQ